MSDHGHDAHGGHDDHGHHEEHGHGGHDEHGHDDHGHGERWGDYNSKPPGPNTLPPVSGWGLLAMGVVLAVLLGLIVNTSLTLATHGGHHEAGHGAGEKHEPQAKHPDKAEH